MRVPVDARLSGESGTDRARQWSTPLGVLVKAAVVIGLLVGISYNLLGFPGLRELGSYYRLDLDVYRLGGKMFLDGPTLYGSMPPTHLGKFLPFTYPPLAAILFSPLSVISLDLAGILLTVASLVALTGVLVVTLESLGIARRTTMLWMALGGLAIALALEPVYSTLDYGQINIALMALVTADALMKRTPWPRGVLIGLAAAIKLTPAVFILYFLIRRDFRAATVTALSFAAFTAIGFFATWSDSVKYWTHTLLDSSRIGTPAYPANQSLTGMLARLGLSESIRTPVWMLLGLAVLALAAAAMIRAARAGESALALGLNAILGLLVSPVSWSHHWVWAIPLILVLGVMAFRRRSVALAALALTGITLIYLALHWTLGPGRWNGRNWPLWDQFLASSYVWWGLGVVVTAIIVLPRRPVLAATASPSGDAAVPVG